MIVLRISLSNIGKIRIKMGQKRTTFPVSWVSTPTELQFSIYFFSLICSQPRDKQKRTRNFLLSKDFLNNLLLTVFMQNKLSKFVELFQQKMNNSLLGETRARFAQQSVRNVSAKFKVDPFPFSYWSCSPPRNFSLAKILPTIVTML